MLSEERIKELKKIAEKGQIARKKLDEYNVLIQRKKCLNNLKSQLVSCKKITIELGYNHNMSFEVKMESHALNKLDDILDNEIDYANEKLNNIK